MLPPPQDPDYEARVRAAFDRQRFMRLLGAQMTEVAPGRIVLRMPLHDELTQQHGFVHGGVLGALLDTACGFAASSLMPADVGVLTVEYKINFLAAARGDSLQALAQVRRAGRTVTFVEGEAIAIGAAGERLAATMQATMMTVRDRPGVRQ